MNRPGVNRSRDLTRRTGFVTIPSHLRSPKICRVCGGPRSIWAGGCTNGRCAKCHEAYCTPGGNTSQGHGYGKVPG